MPAEERAGLCLVRVIANFGPATEDPFEERGQIPGDRARLPDMSGSRCRLLQPRPGTVAVGNRVHSSVPGWRTRARRCAVSERRLVGIDLGITSRHTVAVLGGDSSTVCRRSCVATQASLTEIEQAALAGTEPGLQLEVVMEATGPSWGPVAYFFARRGHRVYRVSSAKAAALRKALSRNAKTNSIDAQTLARLPLVDPQGVYPWRPPSRAQAALDRRVRACARLTKQSSQSKVRLRALVRESLPMTPLGAVLSKTELALLERTGADPDQILKLGRTRLTRLISKVSAKHLGVEVAERWLEAAAQSRVLYGEGAEIAFAERAREIRTEVHLLAAYQAELVEHERGREAAYQQVDPEQLARSLSGVAEAGGPTVLAGIGEVGRFRNGSRLVSFTGLAPRASQTGESDRKGQPMSKAGPRLLRTALIRAADTARTQDPQLARIYYEQMTNRGANHLKALCVVATHLTRRLYAVMVRQTPYQLRDTDGRAITGEQGKAIVAAHWTVSEEVRRRRRSRTTRKAPQQVQRPALNANRGITRRPSSTSILPPSATPHDPAEGGTNVPT